jgi:hypothetical protein
MLEKRLLTRFENCMRYSYSTFVAYVTGTSKCSVCVEIVQVPQFCSVGNVEGTVIQEKLYACRNYINTLVFMENMSII